MKTFVWISFFWGRLFRRLLIWISTKNDQPAAIWKWTPMEINFNNYIRLLMSAWQANLGVQYVTNTHACVLWVASYVSKPDKTSGDILEAVFESWQHLGQKMSTKSVAKKLTHREVSAQEAIKKLMSLPLIQGSWQFVFCVHRRSWTKNTSFQTYETKWDVGRWRSRCLHGNIDYIIYSVILVKHDFKINFLFLIFF